MPISSQESAAIDNMIDEARRNRVLTDGNLPQFYKRLEDAPPHLSPAQKVRQAIDNTFTDRIARDLASVDRTFHNVEGAAQQMQQDIAEKGVLGTAWDIGKSIVTAPIQSIGEIASGRPIESPLQTTLGLVGLLPLAYGAAGIASRIGRGAISKAAARAVTSPAMRTGTAAIEATDMATSDEYLFHEMAASAATMGAGALRPKPQQTVDPTQPDPLNQQPAGASPPAPPQPPPQSTALGEVIVSDPQQRTNTTALGEVVINDAPDTWRPPNRRPPSIGQTALGEVFLGQTPPQGQTALGEVELPPTRRRQPTTVLGEVIPPKTSPVGGAGTTALGEIVTGGTPAGRNRLTNVSPEQSSVLGEVVVEPPSQGRTALGEVVIGNTPQAAPTEPTRPPQRQITGAGITRSLHARPEQPALSKQAQKKQAETEAKQVTPPPSAGDATGDYQTQQQGPSTGTLSTERTAPEPTPVPEDTKDLDESNLNEIGRQVIVKRGSADVELRFEDHVDTAVFLASNKAGGINQPAARRYLESQGMSKQQVKVMYSELSKRITSTIKSARQSSGRRVSELGTIDIPKLVDTKPPTSTPPQETDPQPTPKTSELEQVRKRRDEKRAAADRLYESEEYDYDLLAALENEIAELDARIEELSGEGVGGITLYSDPFTASLVEGGKLLKGASKWISNRIKTDYSIPSSPTGGIDPNIAKEKVVNKTISPGMKSVYENVRHLFAAGMTELNNMGLGEDAARIEQNLQLDSSRMANQWIQKIEPAYREMDKLVNARFAETGRSKKAVKAEIHFLVQEYVERGPNKAPISDPEIKAIADQYRQVWGDLVKEHNNLFYNDLPSYLQTNHQEVFYKLDENFEPVPWFPDIEGATYDPETKSFIRKSDGAKVSMEEAEASAEGIYMPHHFPAEYWVHRQAAVADRINRLRSVSLTVGKPIPGHRFDPDTLTYTRSRDGATFTDMARAIKEEVAHQQKILDNARKEAEMSRPDIRDRVGSLERSRSTNEQDYLRDLDLIPIHLMEVARRYHEIKMFGQRDPYTNELPRYEAYIARAKDATQSDREREIKKVYDDLTEHSMFEQLGAINYDNKQSSAAILNRMQTINVNKLIQAIPSLNVKLLLDIGFFRETSPGNYIISESDAFRHFAWFNGLRQTRAHAMQSVLEGMTNWNWKNPTDAEYNKFWRTMSDITTGLTLNPLTSIRNVTTELPLLASMVGTDIFAQSIKQFLTDGDIRELVAMTHSGGMQATQYFTEGKKFGSIYLKGILYTGSEAFVRNVGTLAGRLAAKKAIKQYVADPNRSNTAQLEYLKLDQTIIDDYISQNGTDINALDSLLREADERTREGHVAVGEALKPEITPQASVPIVDAIANEINRTGAYVSDTIFKPYNRLSQPQFLSSKNPVERTLFKFKAWIAQTFRLMRQTTIDAISQAKKGNHRPMFNLISAFTMMGIGGMATKALFDALAGREDREGFSGFGFIDGLAASGAMHIFSIIWEQVRYADGNTFKANQTLLGFLSSPTAGVAARIGSQLLVGDVPGAAEETARVFPVTREWSRMQGLIPQPEGEQ